MLEPNYRGRGRDGCLPYAGPDRRRFDRSMLLSDADVRLLVVAEHAYTYRPRGAAECLFDILVAHLRWLRDRGLQRLNEGRIMKTQLGAYLLAGPCDLTEAGRVPSTRTGGSGRGHEDL